jgi:hypothetical protein
MATEIEVQESILADLWLNYRDDEEFQDFIEYNDIGLPLAYMSASGIAEPSDIGTRLVSETFALLLAALDITEDPGFETLDDLLGEA